MSDRLVCICNVVSEKEIIRELKKGAKETDDIQKATKAGTSCGKCLVIIDQIVDEFYMMHRRDLQGRLEF